MIIYDKYYVKDVNSINFIGFYWTGIWLNKTSVALYEQIKSFA